MSCQPSRRRGEGAVEVEEGGGVAAPPRGGVEQFAGEGQGGGWSGQGRTLRVSTGADGHGGDSIAPGGRRPPLTGGAMRRLGPGCRLDRLLGPALLGRLPAGGPRLERHLRRAVLPHGRPGTLAHRLLRPAHARRHHAPAGGPANPPRPRLGTVPGRALRPRGRHRRHPAAGPGHEPGLLVDAPGRFLATRPPSSRPVGGALGRPGAGPRPDAGGPRRPGHHRHRRRRRHRLAHRPPRPPCLRILVAARRCHRPLVRRLHPLQGLRPDLRRAGHRRRRPVAAPPPGGLLRPGLARPGTLAADPCPAQAGAPGRACGRGAGVPLLRHRGQSRKVVREVGAGPAGRLGRPECHAAGGREPAHLPPTPGWASPSRSSTT